MVAATGLLIVFYFFYCLASVECKQDYDMYLERFDAIEGDNENLFDFSHVNVVRKGSDHFLNGDFTFFVEMDDSYQFGITSSYSSSGNGRFIKYPLTIAKTPVCEFFNTTYRKYIEPGVLGRTSFTVIPPEGLCPIPKGSFTTENAFVDKTNLPQHVPKAVWKLECRFYKGSSCVGGFNIYLRVVDKN